MRAAAKIHWPGQKGRSSTTTLSLCLLLLTLTPSVLTLASCSASQVGAGKSSLLAALLGELLPLPGPAPPTRAPGSAAGDPSSAAPLVHGRMAYCSQVPWIVSGSVRVRPA